MVATTDIKKTITQRMLKFMDYAINTGLCVDVKDFAGIAGTTAMTIYNLRHGTGNVRSFTLEQIYKIAMHFKLDMNFIFFNIGSPIREGKKRERISDQLKELIFKLEAMEDEVLPRNSTRNKKEKTQ